ncbi:MAG: cyclic nucleotide-binding domain-containing protein [Vicinamibacterales bacterium]
MTSGQAPDVVARRLAPYVTMHTASAGTPLCEAGEPAGHVLLVIHGIVESSDTGHALARDVIAAAPGAGVFPQTVRARTEVRFARVPVAAFEAEGAAAQIHDVSRRILGVLYRRELMAKALAVFGSLDEAALARIENESEWIELERGGVLMRQDEPGDRVFVLLAGRLQAVSEQPDGRTRVVGSIAVGETIGEMAFFSGEPRSSTVLASRDSVLIALARPTVERLIADRPESLRHVIKVQIDRVRRANQGQAVRAPLTNIAVVPLDDAVPIAAFCRQLTAALQQAGQTVHLDADEFDRRLGRPGLADSVEAGPDAPRLAVWFEELERSVRFVVYETSARHEGWVARAISRADGVVFVGRAAGSPAPTAIEALVAREEGEHGAAQRVLVLLHEDEALPRGTGPWLAARAVQRHHHVRLSRPDDVARVARFLSGRAVGLALGAGGARGFAHIGVLRALQEAGIPIDLVGGTSMGAAMAAQHAMGWSVARIETTADEVWNTIRPHAEYTLPLLSLLRGTKARKCGLMMYGTETAIEDLWLPFFCVSSDLTDASMFVHRSGSLLDAVTASSSMPAVIVPTLVGDHLLCDGSLFNTLPVDVAREYGCGTLMASRVSVAQDKDFVYERIPSLREVLRSKLTRTPVRYPSIMSVLSRSSMLAAVDRENREAQAADLLFAPPVDQFGLMEFASIATIVQVGYTYAVAQVASWEQAGRFAGIRQGRAG